MDPQPEKLLMIEPGGRQCWVLTRDRAAFEKRGYQAADGGTEAETPSAEEVAAAAPSGGEVASEGAEGEADAPAAEEAKPKRKRRKAAEE